MTHKVRAGGKPRSAWRRNQPGFWSNGLTRGQMDQRKPVVGDRVSCAGMPFIIEYIDEDGRIGLAYDKTHAPQPPTK